MQFNTEPRKIVIIEDDLTLQENIKIICELLGHEVVGAYDRACPSAESDCIKADLVLLDINLPGEKSGVEFAESLLRKNTIPVIYITGNIEEETFNKATNNLLHGYLPKPVSKEQLDFAIKVSSIRTQCEKMMQDHLHEYYQKEKMIEIGRFAGGFIHDLNNFNAVVITGMTLAENYMDDQKLKVEHPKLTNFLTTSRRGAEKIDAMSQTYRKILNSELKIEYSAVSIKKLFEELQFYFRTRLKNHEIEFYIDTPEDLGIVSSEILLLQALVNLVANSIDAIADSDSIERWIKVSASLERNELCLLVSDSGPGIPKKVAQNIFDHGFTTKMENGQSGSGFGLSFVKESIEQSLLGSFVLLDDTPNTTFEIKVPYLSEKEIKAV